jgi:type II secretory pathway component PulC
MRARLGLDAGDVIVAINRVRMRSAEDVRQAFDVLAGTGRVQMYIERNGDYLVRTLYWRQ